MQCWSMCSSEELKSHNKKRKQMLSTTTAADGAQYKYKKVGALIQLGKQSYMVKWLQMSANVFECKGPVSGTLL